MSESGESGGSGVSESGESGVSESGESERVRVE